MRLRRALCLQILASITTYACGHHEDAQPAPAGVIYEGAATDEGLATMLAIAATDDSARAPTLIAPASGAVVPLAAPPRFEWSAPTATAPARQPKSERFLFAPMKSAHAHGTPMNGRAYLLTLRSNSTDLLRVFTTNTSYTPSAAAWQKVASAGTITATITTASFDNNKVVTGPYRGAASFFSITR